MLVDAKIEYTKQLTNILVPYIFEGLKSIYETSKGVCKLNNDSNVLMRFQEQLSQIPKWNQEIIDDEYNRIIENSGCDWLDELVTAVFLSHTKILTSIKSSKKKNKINLKIPKIDHFIHKCYIESAREIWKNPYLFSDDYKQCDYQRNLRDCNHIINESIQETIRKLLPVKNILKEYLGENDEESNFVPEQYRDNLRKLVKKELELVKQDETNNVENLESVPENDINIENNDLLKIVDVDSGKTQKTCEVISNDKVEDLKTDTTLEEVKTETVEEVKTETVEDVKTESVEDVKTETVEDVKTESVEDVKTETVGEVKTETLDDVKTESVDDVKTETVDDVKTETVDDVETDNTLEEVKVETVDDVETDNTLEVKDLEVVKEDSMNLDNNLEEVNVLENTSIDNTPLEEVNVLDNQKELSVSEENETNSLNLEIKELDLDNDVKNDVENDVEKSVKDQEEIKDIKLINNIINNDLYDKNLDSDGSETEDLNLDNNSSLDEIKLDNLNFKKININDMKVESLDVDDLNFDQNVEDEDIEVLKPVEEDKKEDSNIKKIVIDDDRNNLKKFAKDKKSFRFFD